MDSGKGYVRALEQDAAAVRREMAADQIDERGLAGAVRTHQREKFALVDGEIHAIAGVDIAELFAEIDGLQKDHADFSFGRSLAVAAESAPTMPVGKSMTSSTRTTPSRSCQYSVGATAEVLRYVKRRPPTIGPVKFRKPRSNLIKTISPENVQYSTSGVVRPLSGTQRIPASPVMVPEMRNATQRNRRIRK